MGIPERINKLMKKQGLTRYKLAKASKVPYTTLIKILDGTTKNPQIETLSAIAEVLNVSVDDLSNPWIDELIEEGLKKSGMSIQELAERTKLKLDYLLKIDDVIPDPWDYEPGGTIDKIANVLNLNRRELAIAFSRQEPPVYDGPRSIPEEDFADVDFSDTVDEEKLREEVVTYETADKALKSLGTNIIEVVDKELTEEQILTLAAHKIGHEGELTKEQLAQIKLAMKIALAKENN